MGSQGDRFSRYVVLSFLFFGFPTGCALERVADRLAAYHFETRPVYSSPRRGAVCEDGWTSRATGSGACSHHGGVRRWLYSETEQVKVLDHTRATGLMRSIGIGLRMGAVIVWMIVPFTIGPAWRFWVKQRPPP